MFEEGEEGGVGKEGGMGEGCGRVAISVLMNVYLPSHVGKTASPSATAAPPCMHNRLRHIAIARSSESSAALSDDRAARGGERGSHQTPHSP